MLCKFGLICQLSHLAAQMGSCFTKEDPKNSVLATNVVKGQPLVRLLGSALCPFTSSVRIALQYKCLNVQDMWISSDDNVTSSQLQMLQSIRPDAKLPILQHGTETVFGPSDAILQYIETRFPEPRLVPEGPLGDIALDWVIYVRDIFSPVIQELLYESNILRQKELLMKLDTTFTRLSTGTGEYSSRGPYFLGNIFSMVDVYLIPMLCMLRPLQYYRGVAISPVHSHLLNYSRSMITFPYYAPVRMDPEQLMDSVSKKLVDRAPAPILTLTVLQHRIILHHLEKLVKNADDLAMEKQEALKSIDPTKGSVSMQLKKLSRTYTQLLDLMQEHAQMEERIIFPALEKADKGITRVANEEHARDFPLMNGIQEHLKTLSVFESGSADRMEALLTLSVRLRKLQAHCMGHFQEEEQRLLPLLDAADLNSKEQEALLGSCFSLMEISHGQNFHYLLSGLLPHEIISYFEVAQRCHEKNKVLSMIQSIGSANVEFKKAMSIAEKTLPAITL